MPHVPPLQWIFLHLDSTNDLRKAKAQESAPGSDDRNSSPTTAGRAAEAAEPSVVLDATLANSATQFLITVTDGTTGLGPELQ